MIHIFVVNIYINLF